MSIGGSDGGRGVPAENESGATTVYTGMFVGGGTGLPVRAGTAVGGVSFAWAGMLNSTFGAGAGGCAVAGAEAEAGCGRGAASGGTMAAYSCGTTFAGRGRVCIAAHWQLPGFPAAGSSLPAFKKNSPASGTISFSPEN